MAKNLVIIALSLALLACLYGGIYGWITSDTAQAMQSDHPELEWLRREYSLSDAQSRRSGKNTKPTISSVAKLCRELVQIQKELGTIISTQPEVDEEVQDVLAAWTEQRKRCRQATLLHMYDVSSAMDEDSASRYRARVFRNLIIPGKMPHIGADGEFHEELIEHAAPDSSASTTSDDD